MKREPEVVLEKERNWRKIQWVVRRQKRMVRSRIKMKKQEDLGQQQKKPRTDEVTISKRDTPPAHYMLKVESFSLLSQLVSGIKEKRYESEDFEAGGYKWRLVLYPDGDKAKDVNDHISLYLMIVRDYAVRPEWFVNVNFKFFMYDHIRDKFCAFQDSNPAEVKRFDAMRTEYGFPRLVSLEDFKDGSNGYLFGDTCIFGAEVFLINSTGKRECLSTIKSSGDEKFTWKIRKFSLLKEEMITSKIFTAGGLSWVLELYPKGCLRVRDESLSVYLRLRDSSETVPYKRKLIAQWTIIVKNQKKGLDVTFTGQEWFTVSSMTWGRDKMLSLDDLREPSKGYLINDTLIVEATVDFTARVKYP